MVYNDLANQVENQFKHMNDISGLYSEQPDMSMDRKLSKLIAYFSSYFLALEF